MIDAEQQHWFAVRCVLASGRPPKQDGNRYEERITLWRAETAEQAIDRAQTEATAYAAALQDSPDTFLEFSQSYRLDDDPGDGAEVFSLMRDSDLGPTAYLNSFFDTGREYQGHL